MQMLEEVTTFYTIVKHVGKLRRSIPDDTSPVLTAIGGVTQNADTKYSQSPALQTNCTLNHGGTSLSISLPYL